MGGKTRVGTKTRLRMSRGRKLFKAMFPKDRSKVQDSNIKLVGLPSDEEAMFKFESKNNILYITFNENIIITYTEDMEDEGYENEESK